MTIRRGADWGQSGSLSSDSYVADSDADAAQFLFTAARSGAELPEVGLVGGDLHRSLGAPQRDGSDLVHGRGTRYPVDVIEVVLDGEGSLSTTIWALNSVVVGQGRRFWTGQWTIVMNGSFWAAWNLGPKAHPNDGRLDLTEGGLPLRDRVRARRRAATGAHVPHPSLNESRIRELQIPAIGRRVWIDRVEYGELTQVRVRCLPDAAVVVA